MWRAVPAGSLSHDIAGALSHDSAGAPSHDIAGAPSHDSASYALSQEDGIHKVLVTVSIERFHVTAPAGMGYRGNGVKRGCVF